jgi:hypothetical protein
MKKQLAIRELEEIQSEQSMIDLLKDCRHAAHCRVTHRRQFKDTISFSGTRGNPIGKIHDKIATDCFHEENDL